MLDSICTLPLDHDIFAQAVHPNVPLVTVGLSSGHVASLRLPPVDDDSEPDDVKHPHPSGRRGSNGTDFVDTTWRTKRHKGSCRCLAYSISGQQIYSAGTDGLVKAADVETGRVVGKVAIPMGKVGEEVDAPTVIHALSPQTLLLSTDSGALHLYDLRDPAPSLPLQDGKTAFVTGKPSQTYHPHADYISSLAPIPASAASTSGYSKQFLTTGSTTLALTDLRRGVLAKSEDQEELLLSSLYITGLPAKKSSGSSGEKAVVGGGDGVITLWEKGQWDDQDERIIVSREGETLDCMATLPEGLGGLGKKIAVGMGDGRIRVVRLGMNKVVGEFVHDEVEGVNAIGFDIGGRMISGGGQTLKVWREHIAEDDDDEEDGAAGKRAADSDDDGSDRDQDDSSDEDQGRTRKKKKKKRSKAPQNVQSFDFGGLD